MRKSALKCLVGICCFVLVGLTATGCQKKPVAPAMQAMPVQTMAAALSQVAQSSEYVATIKSRRSATLQPQVSGILTRILVRSGDRVKAGQVLMGIDPQQQEATVASARATERQKKASYDFNAIEIERQRKLFEAGVTSRDTYDQARQAFDNTKADYESAVQLRKTQEAQLAYYTIRAPFGGVVGDIPVHVGDYASPATALTTVDENKDLEAYIYVPTERAGKVRMGQDVELMDNNGKLLEKTKIDFVSPQVDSTLQGILVKAPILLVRIAAQRATCQGARYLGHKTYALGACAGCYAPGRAELCVRGSAAGRPFRGPPDPDWAWRYRGQQLLHLIGSERGRPSHCFQHSVPGERHAGCAAAWSLGHKLDKRLRRRAGGGHRTPATNASAAS
jgi:RND family efflux transporter MFP subunit